MKKIISLMLILGVSTPAFPMAHTWKTVKKYTKPTLQVTSGLAALGLAGYGAYRSGKTLTELATDYIPDLIGQNNSNVSFTLEDNSGTNTGITIANPKNKTIIFDDGNSVTIPSDKGSKISISDLKATPTSARHGYCINVNGVPIHTGTFIKNFNVNGVIINANERGININASVFNFTFNEKSKDNKIGPITVDGKTIANNITVNGNTITITNNQQSPTAPSKTQICDTIIANPMVIAATAFLGATLVYLGIKNFRKAYQKR